MEIYKGVVPFIILQLTGLALVITYPPLAACRRLQIAGMGDRCISWPAARK